jgi:hypothetical protein
MFLEDFDNARFTSKDAEQKIRSALVSITEHTARKGFSVTLADLDELLASKKAITDLVEKYFVINERMIHARRENLPRYSNIRFISIGNDCFSRTVLTRWGIKRTNKMGEKSHPFDLSIHPISTVINLLKNDFSGYLDTDLLEYDEKLGFPVNRSLNVQFNHEEGREFAEDDFAKLRQFYTRRIGNLHSDIAAADRIVFVLHVECPSGEQTQQAIMLSELTRDIWHNKNTMLICINTHAFGAAPDLSHQKEAASDRLTFINETYPFANYTWHKASHSFSLRGNAFEGRVIEKLKKAVPA